MNASKIFFLISILSLSVSAQNIKDGTYLVEDCKVTVSETPRGTYVDYKKGRSDSVSVLVTDTAAAMSVYNLGECDRRSTEFTTEPSDSGGLKYQVNCGSEKTYRQVNTKFTTNEVGEVTELSGVIHSHLFLGEGNSFWWRFERMNISCKGLVRQKTAAEKAASNPSSMEHPPTEEVR